MARTNDLVRKTSNNNNSSQLILGILLCTLILGSLYLGGDGSRRLLEDHMMRLRRNSWTHCNLFSGKWVFDNKSYPLYDEQKCTYMKKDFACRKYGRKDSKYMYWRWQPHHCNLPRFNPTALLEKLRGKRVIFVGDSIMKNQWVSLLCIIDSSIPPSSRSSQWKGSLITFEAFDYNVSIDFYWEPMLEESNCDDPIDHHVQNRIVRVHAIENHARHWTGADIIVFNSFMWWLSPNTTLLWGSFNSSNGIYKSVGTLRQYEMAIRTWSDWLDIHINRTKTQLFFMSLAPYHKMAEDWGMAIGENCYNEKEPISKERFWGSGTDRRMMQIVESAIRELSEKRGLKVQYINITQLSEYRKDAHPSIFREQRQALTKEQLANPSSYADCVHWCLPGVPDVWNELLSAYIN